MQSYSLLADGAYGRQAGGGGGGGGGKFLVLGGKMALLVGRGGRFQDVQDWDDVGPGLLARRRGAEQGQRRYRPLLPT